MEMQRRKKSEKFLSKGLRMAAALLVCMLALQLLTADIVMAETEGVQEVEEAVEEITLMYMDANGEFAQAAVQKAFDELSEADLPECPAGVQFTGWTQPWPPNGPACAGYEGKNLLYCFAAGWMGESGAVSRIHPCCWWIDTEDNIDDKKIQELCTDYFGISAMYPGLRFSYWVYWLFGNLIQVSARYENSFAELDYGELSLPNKVVIGEEGTKVILPTECEGYTDLVWQYGDEIVTELIFEKDEYGDGARMIVTCVGYTPSADAKDQEPVLIPPVEAGEGSSDNTENGTGADNNGGQASQPGQAPSSQPGQASSSQPGQASSNQSGQAPSSQQTSGKAETVTTTANGAVVTQKEMTQSDLNNVQKNVLGTYFTAMQNVEQDAALSAEQKRDKKAEIVQSWINSALGTNYSYKKGVYGVYELKASDLSQTIPILVDGVKAGDKVVIAHLKADGTWESVTATEVTDGAVYAKFESLSPVFVAVTGNSGSTKSPKTGDMDFGVLFAIAAVAALGIAVSVRRRTSETIG